MKLAEHPLLTPHLQKTAILDTNLMLLDWCVRLNPNLLRSFKRLSRFEPEDVILLSELLRLFPGQCTTPHILTEVSSFANQLDGRIKDSWSVFFSKQISLIPESYDASVELASDPIAIRFGLADSALTKLAASHVILTTDGPLTGLLEARNLSVVNFNRLRESVLSV